MIDIYLMTAAIFAIGATASSIYTLNTTVTSNRAALAESLNKDLNDILENNLNSNHTKLYTVN